MKPSSIFFLFIVLFNTSCTQTIDKYDDQQFIEYGPRLRFKGEEFTGILTSHYKNSNLKSKVRFVDGVENGEYEYYYKNGQLQESGTYSDGFNGNSFTKYYENGHVESKSVITDGKLEYKEYQINGTPRLFRLGSDEEWRDGYVESIFYDNGQLRLEETYRENEIVPYFREGDFKRYYKNGQLKEIGSLAITITDSFPMNVYHGEIINYHMNGIEKSRGVYDRGLLIGNAFTEYYDNGNQRLHITLKGDFLSSIHQYYDNGAIMIRDTVIDNQWVREIFDEKGLSLGRSSLGLMETKKRSHRKIFDVVGRDTAFYEVVYSGAFVQTPEDLKDFISEIAEASGDDEVATF